MRYLVYFMAEQLTPDLVKKIVGTSTILPHLDFPEILQIARKLPPNQAEACVQAAIDELGRDFKRFQDEWQDVGDPLPTIEEAIKQGNPYHIAFAVLNARRPENQEVVQPTPFEIAQALGQAYNMECLSLTSERIYSVNDPEIKEEEALTVKEVFGKLADLARQRSLLFHALKDPLKETSR